MPVRRGPNRPRHVGAHRTARGRSHRCPRGERPGGGCDPHRPEPCRQYCLELYDRRVIQCLAGPPDMKPHRLRAHRVAHSLPGGRRHHITVGQHPQERSSPWRQRSRQRAVASQPFKMLRAYWGTDLLVEVPDRIIQSRGRRFGRSSAHERLHQLRHGNLRAQPLRRYDLVNVHAHHRRGDERTGIALLDLLGVQLAQRSNRTVCGIRLDGVAGAQGAAGPPVEAVVGVDVAGRGCYGRHLVPRSVLAQPEPHHHCRRDAPQGPCQLPWCRSLDRRGSARPVARAQAPAQHAPLGATSVDKSVRHEAHRGEGFRSHPVEASTSRRLPSVEWRVTLT